MSVWGENKIVDGDVDADRDEYDADRDMKVC